jgi:hypothetical protein
MWHGSRRTPLARLVEFVFLLLELPLIFVVLFVNNDDDTGAAVVVVVAPVAVVVVFELLN